MQITASPSFLPFSLCPKYTNKTKDNAGVDVVLHAYNGDTDNLNLPAVGQTAQYLVFDSCTFKDTTSQFSMLTSTGGVVIFEDVQIQGTASPFIIYPRLSIVSMLSSTIQQSSGFDGILSIFSYLGVENSRFLRNAFLSGGSINTIGSYTNITGATFTRNQAISDIVIDSDGGGIMNDVKFAQGSYQVAPIYLGPNTDIQEQWTSPQSD